MARFISREDDDPQVTRKLMDYLVKNRDSLSFTRYFWKGCEPNNDDILRFSKFVRAIVLKRDGRTVDEIAGELGTGRASIGAWIQSTRNSKLSDYLRALIRLGRPKLGWVWLSVNNTPGRAIPVGPFIEVPSKIRKWHDVDHVLRRLKTLKPIDRRFPRGYRFGFLLGVMIGDASKKRQATWHRHLELVLSKRYATSLLIGDFFTYCANSFGIQMKRMDDQEAYGNKPHGFYVWESQSTTLVDWLFNVCLGLKDDELTTYNSVRMNWALATPKSFRQGLIQGMAESDGSVSIASQTVEFWIGPNWDFVRRLLLTFGVQSFRSRQALSITKGEIRHLLRVPPFAPHLRTLRFQRFEKLANAQHIPHGTRIPKGIRNAISSAVREGLSIPQISERIVDQYGIALTFEAVQRWAKRPDSSLKKNQ